MSPRCYNFTKNCDVYKNVFFYRSRDFVRFYDKKFKMSFSPQKDTI